MLAPVIDEIASEHDEYKVCKVNVDEEPELASVSMFSAYLLLLSSKTIKLQQRQSVCVQRTISLPWCRNNCLPIRHPKEQYALLLREVYYAEKL